jgi:hypothetical protein
MQIIFVKKKFFTFLLNYRIVFAYLMAVTYLCTHYFVTFTKFENEKSPKKIEFNLEIEPVFKSSSVFLKTTKFSSPSNKSIFQKKVSQVQPLTVKHNPLNFESPKLYLNSNTRQLTHRYNLRNKTNRFYSQIMQDQIVIHLLNTSVLNEANATYGGLFVEAGAYDGETWSNTLYLERFKNWTGLLIEPSVENYRLLRSKNRNAISVNSCLCPGKLSVNSSYIEAGPFGITTNSSSSSTSSFSPIYSITCYPLANIFDTFFSQFSNLKSKKSRIANVLEENQRKQPTIIDYMSLDIEGSEKETIETFPFERYQFNLLNIEFNQNKKIYKWIKNYLKQFGYVEIILDDVWYQDMYLAHESIVEKLNRQFNKVSQLFKK